MNGPYWMEYNPKTAISMFKKNKIKSYHEFTFGLRAIKRKKIILIFKKTRHEKKIIKPLEKQHTYFFFIEF